MNNYEWMWQTILLIYKKRKKKERNNKERKKRNIKWRKIKIEIVLIELIVQLIEKLFDLTCWTQDQMFKSNWDMSFVSDSLI